MTEHRQEEVNLLFLLRRAESWFSDSPPHVAEGDSGHEQGDGEVASVPFLVIICVSFSVSVEEAFVKHGHFFAVQGAAASLLVSHSQAFRSQM